MPDHIRITPGQLSDSLALRSASALKGCTDIDTDAVGLVFTITTPSPSTGEALLLDVLRWLNGAPSLPVTSELREFGRRQPRRRRGRDPRVVGASHDATAARLQPS